MIFKQHSIKIKIAVCHFDFAIENLAAKLDDAYINVLKKINEEIVALPAKPHLIIFPECSYSDLLYQYALKWKSDFSISTVCGTRQNSTTGAVEAVVLCNAQTYYFEKRYQSPYDTLLTSRPVRDGKSAGGTFDIEAKTKQGKKCIVTCGILICYDFHKPERFADDFQDVNVMIVPMYNPRWRDAQELAYEYVKHRSSRVILVNKSKASIEVAKNSLTSNKIWMASALARRPLLMKAVEFTCAGWLPSFFLASSGHGPVNESDNKNLKSNRRLSFLKKLSRIWEVRKDAILIADYEVGVECSIGHENKHNSGYFYENFQKVDL